MEKYNLKVISVRVYDDCEKPSVSIGFDKPIKGFTKAEDGSYNEADVTDISINRSQFTRQLCNANELIATFRSARGKALDQRSFGLILPGATLTIVRTLRAKGEQMVNSEGQPEVDADGNAKCYQRDCYTTDVVGIALTDIATARLDRVCQLSID